MMGIRARTCWWVSLLLLAGGCASDDSPAATGAETAGQLAADRQTTAAGQPSAGTSGATAVSDPVAPPSTPVAAGAPSGAGAPAAATGTPADGPVTPGAQPPATAMQGEGPTMMPGPGMPVGMPEGTPNDGDDPPARTPRMDDTCLKPGDGTYSERGPYQVGMMDIDLGMIQERQNSGMFTIFYPMPMEENCLHPIVAWGNGTTVRGSATYAFFNSNAAAWGMVVAASHEDNAGSGNFHKAALDWLLEQNDDPDSIFYQKLSTRAGTSGHSQGGFGASAGSSHPNVEAQVSVGAGGRGTEKVAVLVLTGTMDILGDNPGGLVDRATGPAFVASWEGGDHFVTQTVAGYIGRDPGTMQMQRFYAAWFR
ncbi:MAG: hypothetical protein OXU20_34920, partial [Myxococcales bacterium]|nr:hypothetical protein [Myxococcales bacterium]